MTAAPDRDRRRALEIAGLASGSTPSPRRGLAAAAWIVAAPFAWAGVSLGVGAVLPDQEGVRLFLALAGVSLLAVAAVLVSMATEGLRSGVHPGTVARLRAALGAVWVGIVVIGVTLSADSGGVEASVYTVSIGALLVWLGLTTLGLFARALIWLGSLVLAVATLAVALTLSA